MLEGARRLDRVPTTFGEQPRHQQQTHVVQQLLCGLLLKRPQRRVLLFHGQDRGEDEVCDAWRPPGTTHEVLVVWRASRIHRRCRYLLPNVSSNLRHMCCHIDIHSGSSAARAGSSTTQLILPWGNKTLRWSSLTRIQTETENPDVLVSLGPTGIHHSLQHPTPTGTPQCHLARSENVFRNSTNLQRNTTACFIV